MDETTSKDDQMQHTAKEKKKFKSYINQYTIYVAEKHGIIKYNSLIITNEEWM